MPTYEYECQACLERVEAVQRFSDPDLTTCEACGGALRKVFSAVGIVFKGSGFYKNDSRGTGASSSASTPPATPAPSSESGPAPATPVSTPSPAPSGSKD